MNSAGEEGVAPPLPQRERIDWSQQQLHGLRRIELPLELTQSGEFHARSKEEYKWAPGCI
jgi:hypothetical protein